MALEGRRLPVLIRRLSAIDARARRRLMRLMDIGETEASVVLALAAGGPLTRADLRAQLELSAGGAEALTRKLVDQALVVRAPDPNDRTGVRLRLSDGADVELADRLVQVGQLDQRTVHIAEPLVRDEVAVEGVPAARRLAPRARG